MQRDDVSGMDDGAGAHGFAVDSDAAEHLQAAERMRAQRKASGYDAAYGSPIVLSVGDMGQDSHTFPPLI